jgi:PAS domain S-box-containing protein
MNKISKISLFFGIIGLVSFLTMHTLIYTELMLVTESVLRFSFYSKAFIVFCLIVFIIEYLKRNKVIEIESEYTKKLIDVLISQSHNPLFYVGNTIDGAKILTNEVTETINTDRCSIWLYNEDKTSIICEQLFVKSENKWYSGTELFKKDFESYFTSLIYNPIIIANDAETHQATNCFKDSYLKPLGIKSMLDVPIIYGGDIIGVICIESLTKREWTNLEVNFAQILSSLYSFAYSVKISNNVSKNIKDIEGFIDYSVLVSKADKNGKITYVNKRFEEVSGWSLSEVLGQDHNIVNSGAHPKKYWSDMYKTILVDNKIWNNVVTNKNKNGELYWVDSYIKAEFDSDNNLTGFMSIRYDVTELMKTLKEIDKKNTYLEHAAKILRHDMHSGINTYIPRGLSSLERRLTNDDIERLKIEGPLKMLREGLKHSQKVYKGVYEFTNLVKKDAVLEKTVCNVKEILDSYLSSTSYKSQVVLEELPTLEVNESLFCTAVDNLIRNGLKYNDSDTKFVKIYSEESHIIIQDNGRGITQKDFEKLSQPYTRKEGQKESGTGLGLNICIAILKEHGFEISCEKNKIGTKIKIKIKN